jgi:hypothetical protein
MEETEAKPGSPKRGGLSDRHPGGNPHSSPRCGARAKSTGRPCRAPGVRKADGTYSRCRLHGGTSTGARTPEGLARCRTAALKHGYFTAEALQARKAEGTALRELTHSLKEVMNAAAALCDRWEDGRQEEEGAC